MEVNKITFELLKTGEISKSFEELDINGDGKITAEDLNEVQDSSVKSQIKTVLNSVDEESSIEKSGAYKSKVKSTDSSHFKNDVTNSKGTVYLIMGNLPGCGRCTSLDKEIAKNLSKLQAKAKLYNINWNANNNLCWNLYKKLAGKDAGGVGFPVVLKFVDGKLKEIISEGSADYKKVVKNMINKAEESHETTETTENTENTQNTQNTQNTENTGKTTSTASTLSAKTADDIKKAAEDLLAKYPPGETTQDYDRYSSNNPSLQAFKKAMDDGIIESLSQQGFTRENIVDIIAQAYPSIGVKNNTRGGYDCPKGHGQDAKDIYNTLVEQLSKTNSAEKAAMLAQIKELNLQISDNNQKLSKFKAAITLMKNEVEKIIEDAIKESEEIKEEQKEEATKIVKEEMDKYAVAEGSISFEEFQNNVSGRLDSLSGSASSKLSSVVLKMINAESKMGILKGYIDNFKTLIDANKGLAEQVKTVSEEIEKTAQGESQNGASRCDPIGFTVNGVRYDFFKDTDNDGKLSNENEFFGAKDGWAEMKALDVDGNGKVSVAEMGDMMLVTKDAQGNQIVKKASELFSSSDAVDLNSYQNMNQNFENGNTLLGTFSMSFGGQEIKDAYNTMDKISWLDENYEFSDKENGINRFAQDAGKTEEISDFSSDLETFNASFIKMEGDLLNVWTKLGFVREDMAAIIQDAQDEADGKKAKDIEEQIKKKVQAENKTEQ